MKSKIALATDLNQLPQVFPPPLRGRIKEGGDIRTYIATDTPHPNLSPQGGKGFKALALLYDLFKRSIQGISLALLIASPTFASLTGVDDLNPNIPEDTQKQIDKAVMTYYESPSIEKVDTVLDIMSDSKLLQKKTAWAPMIGFLTVVFADHKNHVMKWMSRNDYNDYAVDAIVAALMHAGLKESALVFAQAEQWKEEDLERLRAMDDKTDLKHLPVIVPGHIDTLWGAFFGSGDPVYLNEIIDVLFMEELPPTDVVQPTDAAGVLDENKKLAHYTLREYAGSHKAVRKALQARIAAEEDPAAKKLLKDLLPKMTPLPTSIK